MNRKVNEKTFIKKSDKSKVTVGPPELCQNQRRTCRSWRYDKSYAGKFR